MALAFQMDGNNPKGLWSGSGTVPTGTLACTQAQADQFRAGGAVFPGTSTFRWTYISDVLAAVADTRRLVTWGHTPGVGVQVGSDWEFDLEVGDAEPVVTASLPGSATRDDIVKLLPSGHHIKFKFVGGVVSLNIKTDKPTRYVIKSADTVRFANKLTVRVRAVDLYGV